ncbi:MAG TPA: sulfite exporter TauE/SafE family protein [Clostridiales bacterium]|nr:sulfite exporter TauE/SafE family protein [Clostridiales bacterium]
MRKMEYIKVIICGLATGLFNGLFGAGGGIVLVPSLVLLLGVEEHDAHATAISVILPLTLISAFIYYTKGIANWDITLRVALGGMLGGYIGAKVMNRLSANLLRKIFSIFMVAAAIRMMV